MPAGNKPRVGSASKRRKSGIAGRHDRIVDLAIIPVSRLELRVQVVHALPVFRIHLTEKTEVHRSRLTSRACESAEAGRDGEGDESDARELHRSGFLGCSCPTQPVSR